MKPSFNTLRRSLTGAFAAAGVATLLCAAHADSYTVSASASSSVFNPSATISWASTVPLAKFDATKGTLTGVSVIATWNTTEQIIVQNTTSSISQAYIQYNAMVDLTMPDGVTTLFGTAAPLTLGSLDSGGNPTAILAGNSTTYVPAQPGPGTYAPAADGGAFPGSPYIPSDLTPYLGAGSVNFVAASDGTEASNITGGNDVVSTPGTAGVTITITYTYTPSTKRTPGVATRTWGFYKTHLGIFTTIVGDGFINLGSLIVTPQQGGGPNEDLSTPSLGQLEAIFWTSPGGSSTSVGAARLALAHQLIAAECNAGIGTLPSDKGYSTTLISDAIAALDGIDTAAMNTLASQLDGFNNSGDTTNLPSNWTEGKANIKGSQGAATSTGPAFK